MTRPALMWFRQDLRLADNPALAAAASSGAALAALYVRDAGALAGRRRCRWRRG